MADNPLRAQILALPDKPGVYRFYDGRDQLLYIGKARNLKKRVGSYFTKSSGTAFRIRHMASKVRVIRFTVVATEYDALLLESAQIREYQPRYNVEKKDDKSYPYIVILNERIPRLFPTRNTHIAGAEYYGPYSNVGSMKVLLDLLRKLFPYRTCNFNLSAENVSAGKFRVCLDYHIKLCKGPCEGHQTEEEYQINLQNIRHILKGKIGEASEFLKAQISAAAERLAFEEAQGIAERLTRLEQFQARSTVVNPDVGEVDVCTLASNDQSVFLNYMRVINGTIITSDTIEYKRKLDEGDAELLLMGVEEMRKKYGSAAKEVLVPFPILMQHPHLKFVYPKIGDKRKLLDLSKKNAFEHYNTKLKRQEENRDKRKNMELLTQMQQDLMMKNIPYHIECFDNSNLQGTNPVSAIVVFRNGLPSKRDYRIFNVRTVEGPDDFATMEEAVYRRYRRMLDEEQPLPQLIIIDGGKGQLSSAVKSLRELGLEDKVDIIGIAKKLEEIYRPGDPLPLSINKRSPSLRLIQQARDEAHRFGITRHRAKRTSAALTTGLEDIAGIGDKTAAKLLKHFKSVKRIKAASAADLASVIGEAKGKMVYQALQPEGPSQ